MTKAVANSGATSCAFTLVHLNGALGHIFIDWITKTMPDKAHKVLNQIKACHNGSLNDSRFGLRKRGEGKIADHLHKMMALAKHKYFKDKTRGPGLNTKLHAQFKTGQMSLF